LRECDLISPFDPLLVVSCSDSSLKKKAGVQLATTSFIPLSLNPSDQSKVISISSRTEILPFFRLEYSRRVALKGCLRSRSLLSRVNIPSSLLSPWLPLTSEPSLCQSSLLSATHLSDVSSFRLNSSVSTSSSLEFGLLIGC